MSRRGQLALSYAAIRGRRRRRIVFQSLPRPFHGEHKTKMTRSTKIGSVLLADRGPRTRGLWVRAACSKYFTVLETDQNEKLFGRQFFFWKQKDRRRARMDNIRQQYVHDKSFVREAGTIPFYYFIMAADEAIHYLGQHGGVLFIDGTFSLVEGGMVLTTIMIQGEGGVGVPVAWLLSQSQTQETYTHFFLLIKKMVLQMTGHVLQPLAVFVDFEEALRSAAASAFPGTRVYGESFHFMQANLRWMAKHVGKHHWDVLIPSLRQLVLASELSEVSAHLKTFMAYWAQECPAYVEYFRSVWCSRWPPSLWTAYGRKQLRDLPSGDHILEGWHNRLQHHTWPQRHEAADHAIHYLWEEWTLYSRLLSSPEHLAAHAQAREADARKWRNKAAAQPAHAPPVPTITAPTSSGARELGGAGEESESALVVTLVEEGPPSPSPGMSVMCPICTHTKANAQCVLKACQRCCVQNVTSHCRVAKHRAGKAVILRQPLLAKLEELFALPPAERPPLYVQYMGGSRPGMVRSLTPIKWAAHLSSFIALDEAEGKEKKYLLARIAEWRESFWTPSP